MFDFLAYGFMQRAYLVGVLTALICPTIGLFLVLRRLSMVGEMFAHVSLAGIALGIFLGTAPLITAMFLSLGAAAALEGLRRTHRILTDLAVAIMISAGISLAVILISMRDAFNADLFAYLFGSIIAIPRLDFHLIATVAAIVIAVVFLLHKELFCIAFDEDMARASGIPVDLINSVFVLLTSLTIVVSIRAVGVLLVASLITVPVATALQVGHSFRATIYYAYIFSVLAVLSGLTVSYYAGLAPSGAIVFMAILMLLVTITARKLSVIGGNKHVHDVTTANTEGKRL